ncbi:hypothetical protein L486_03827 [Kwoniella mangroviensis CBS 10435]|uniref:Secreted protein n=1 Tax=Kwoniella mangroviensis CBS 10435 TaxID=1331196 RepID=A0A1B9IV75_9TREE|nr:hypothetical protein L486_03827 [Kwoniella mangroviensis CBS 10435]
MFTNSFQTIFLSAPLALSITSTSASPILEGRDDVDTSIQSQVWLPAYTRIVNRPGLPGLPEGGWGPCYIHEAFTRSQLENTLQDDGSNTTTKTDSDGWNRRKMFWYIYKNTGTLQSKPLIQGGQPINPLGDEDILYNMTCYDSVHKSAVNGTFFDQQLDLSASTIVRPHGYTSWENLKGKAAFYCPEGECIHEDCKGLPVPTWNQSTYDKQNGTNNAIELLSSRIS